MNKKVNILKLIISSLLILAFLIVNVGKAAAEANLQVPTKGAITLFDETSTSNNENPAESSDQVVKPKGRLPSTGEFTYKLVYSGVALLVLVCLFYLMKTRRQKQAHKKEEQ